jgi:tripartite-type tricarboxylate transporter receptor subunit TctC
VKAIHAMLLAAAFGLTLWAGGHAVAADNAFEGKNVTLILPNSPAGPMAQYARTMAPFINKHLGSKTVRVDIQQGAGGLKGASSVWRAAPDGLTFAITNLSALIMAPLAGSPGASFDSTKFTYLGRVEAEPRVLVVGGKSKIKTLQDIRDLGRPFVFASQGTDEDFYSMAILADSLGFKLKIVTGYEGIADTALAVIKGDADGHMTSYASSKPAIDAGDKRLVLSMSEKRLEAAPNVPTALELVTDAAKKPALVANVAILGMGRGFFGPPGMPPEVAGKLRDAITASLKDPELKTEMDKRHLDIDSESGEQQQQEVAKIVAAGENLKQVLHEALETIR